MNTHIAEQTNNDRTQENNYPDSITRQEEGQFDKFFHGLCKVFIYGIIGGILLALLDVIITQQLNQRRDFPRPLYFLVMCSHCWFQN